MFSGEIIISLLIMGIIFVACLFIFFIAKKIDPLKKPSGIISIIEIIILKIDVILKQNNKDLAKSEIISSFLLTSLIYLSFSFFIGLIGLPNPLSCSYIPMSLALCTFILINFTSIKSNGKDYFVNFFRPFAIFFPINLLSIFSTFLSLSLRLFGNAFAGYLLSMLFYKMLVYFWSFQKGIFAFFYFFSPFFHIYFDIVSGFIQIFIFITLSVILIANEKNINGKN